MIKVVSVVESKDAIMQACYTAGVKDVKVSPVALEYPDDTLPPYIGGNGVF